MKDHHSRRIIPGLLMAVVLCLLTSPTTRAGNNRSIVGLWDVNYYAGSTFAFETYVQWHSDGLEFEVASIYPGAVCQGVYQEDGDGKVRDFHVVFTYDSNGHVNGHIEEKFNLIVDNDGDEYHGTVSQRIFDLNGNQVGQGSFNIRATRISLH